ncbi:MAG: DegT/DnrJ/EryC1/StrS family aminotransferase [Chitinophagales bacterium]|nr:DegT/DnrJ/EryC1/StrS family aminotransferase [Hyphomicrobiales bacterium]
MLDKLEFVKNSNDYESVQSFTCKASDGLWTGVERALDNGFGVVFVTDDSGSLVGQASLTEMRAAIRKGAHLGFTTLGEVSIPVNYDDHASPVLPVLNSFNHITSVSIRPEATFLPVAEPDLSHTEMRNAIDAILSTWISSTGDYIRRFEDAFAKKVDMAHGVATSNGTVSLQLALAALGIGEGDEVIVPDLTFPASANTVIHAGARPVLVDIDPETWCVSVETIAKSITSRTRAIMPVHVFGRPAPMTEIQALAKAHGLFVIEDCAEAHGARYDGKPVGSFSDIASFSFFANKIITTGEGGICVTNNPDIAARMRILRDHGMRPDRRYWHEEAGFNFRMTNIQAAIGCAQIERMDAFLATRQLVHTRYEMAFADVPGVTFPPAMPARHEPVVWFSCALTPADKRPALIQACRQSNIDLRPFFHGLSSMPAYKRFAKVCPVSSSLSKSGVNFPTSRKVDTRITTKMADIFRGVLAA